MPETDSGMYCSRPATSRSRGLISVLALLFSVAAEPSNAGPTTSPALTATTQPVRCAIWHNVQGSQITDTLATTALDRPPDEMRSLSTLELTPGVSDQYACSLSALVTPPASGWYKFNIASRDEGVLFLSTDESPEHCRYIAETPASTDLHDYRYYSAQTSDVVKLESGHRYFIQTLFKSGVGPGCVSIAWTLPNGTLQGPIPADRFAPSTDPIHAPSWRIKKLSVSLRPEAVPTTQPGIHKFVKNAVIQLDGRSVEMSYLMTFPKDYAATPDAKPMLVFLHGNSRQGYSLDGVEQTGPIHELEHRKELADWMPIILLAPQLPPGWRWDSPGAPQTVNALVEQLCQRYPRIDRNRIYITGLSMGGKGTWLTLEDSPQTYAAAAPISAVDIRPDLAPGLLGNVGNLHIICGGQDGGFTAGSHRMYEALKPALGDRVQLTVFEDEGHSVWNHYYPTREFYEELLKFSK